MIKLHTTLLCLGLSLGVFAERDSVITLDTNDVFFNLEDGSETFADRHSWHLAFTLGNRDVSILTNEGFGVELFLASSNMADWASFDTSGMSWDNLYNSTEMWEEGALNLAGQSVHPDYGWGTYNQISKDVNAIRFFVLKLGDGSFKKLRINKMTAAGVYTFDYENLDGSNSQSQTIDKANYDARNFVYFNVQTNSVLDIEPLSNSWDLVFTKYMAEIQAGPTVAYYPVSGIKLNRGLRVAQREGTEASSNDTSNLSWSTTITEIGYDWKSFNRTTFIYDIQDSLAFFVKKPNGEVWKLVFTGYEGSGQGKYIFDSEKISEGSGTIGLEESMTKEINFYPNPSKGILYFSDQVDHVSVYNTMGQLVYERRETLKSIDLNGLNTGSYFVKMSNENSSSHRTLIIE